MGKKIIMLIFFFIQSVVCDIYNIERATSYNGQLNTMMFDALAFWTGDFNSASYFPPGKVCDYWGFQSMRDNDPSGNGHSGNFLNYASLNVLSILNSEQLSKMSALATQQESELSELGYSRLVVVNAIREMTSIFNYTALSEYLSDVYLKDGIISIAQAKLKAEIILSLNTTQKLFLSSMNCGSASWPHFADTSFSVKINGKNPTALIRGYAGDILSWFNGNVEKDVYFCPERHATYFGSFYLKDAQAMLNKSYLISTTITGDAGALTLANMTLAGQSILKNIINAQSAALQEIVNIRRNISTELRKLLIGQTIDEDFIKEKSKEYGKLDAYITYLYANAFKSISLTTTQKEYLTKLRNVVCPLTASLPFLFSTPIILDPNTLPNSDFLFENAV